LPEFTKRSKKLTRIPPKPHDPSLQNPVNQHLLLNTPDKPEQSRQLSLKTSPLVKPPAPMNYTPNCKLWGNSKQEKQILQQALELSQLQHPHAGTQPITPSMAELITKRKTVNSHLQLPTFQLEILGLQVQHPLL
jgi:hypothetical protein